MSERAGKLTERQRKFVELYLQLGNAAEAAERAGFKRSYAQGAMRQTAVRAYLQTRLDEARQRDIALADEVLEYLTKVMRGEIEGEKPERNSSPRMKAAELLGKRLGVFNEVSDIFKQAAPVIVDDIPEVNAAQ